MRRAVALTSALFPSSRSEGETGLLALASLLPKPSPDPMTTTESHRLFFCARCRTLARVCTSCDRGQRYCSKACGQEARRQFQRDAGRRYRRTARGRQLAAERQRRRRRRIGSVTHHGSRKAPILLGDRTIVRIPICRDSRGPERWTSRPRGEELNADQESKTCDFCHQRPLAFVRFKFLRDCRFGRSRRPRKRAAARR